MKNKLIVSLFVLIAIAYSACKKSDAGLPPYTVDVKFNNNNAAAVTLDKTVNPKDSLIFDFNITCGSNMKYVTVQKNGTDVTKDTLSASNFRSFSTVKRFMADSIPGVYTFRFLAKDSSGVFLGDKNIVVTVTSDYTYYTAKTMFVPDTVGKVNPCYFSASTGLTYNYNYAAASSAAIDFGYFYDTTTAGAPKHTIYALNANTFAPYDISSWTKNATIFKRITSPAYSTFTSGAEIKKQCIANLASGTSSKITSLSTNSPAGTLTGNIILFKTAAGKYGVLYITYTNGATASPTTYINFEVKVAN